MSPLRPGDPVPRFQLKGINNMILALDLPDVEGPRLLFFFAREQRDSRAAFPYMERMARTLSQSAGRVWAITADSHGDCLETADQFQLSFQILLDTRNRVRDAYGIRELPALVPVDRELFAGAVLQGFDADKWTAACHEFVTSLGLDSNGLFQEEDWLPGV